MRERILFIPSTEKETQMSNLLNAGIFLGGYCVIGAAAAASIWAIRRECVRSPARGSIKLPSKPKSRTRVSRLGISAKL